MALLDRIKYDCSPDVLVGKYSKDNIVLGSQLIVNESQEAVFFKDGRALDVFGPGRHTISTNNIPLLQKLVNLPFGGDTPFAAEIFFVNKVSVLSKFLLIFYYSNYTRYHIFNPSSLST